MDLKEIQAGLKPLHEKAMTLNAMLHGVAENETSRKRILQELEALRREIERLQALCPCPENERVGDPDDEACGICLKNWCGCLRPNTRVETAKHRS